MVKYKNSKDKLKCGVIRKFKMISPANPVFIFIVTQTLIEIIKLSKRWKNEASNKINI